MWTFITMIGLFVGFEGYEDGKLHIGVYTQSAEYGWVVTDRAIWLDTVYERDVSPKDAGSKHFGQPATIHLTSHD